MNNLAIKSRGYLTGNTVYSKAIISLNMNNLIILNAWGSWWRILNLNLKSMSRLTVQRNAWEESAMCEMSSSKSCKLVVFLHVCSHWCTIVSIFCFLFLQRATFLPSRLNWSFLWLFCVQCAHFQVAKSLILLIFFVYFGCVGPACLWVWPVTGTSCDVSQTGNECSSVTW